MKRGNEFNKGTTKRMKCDNNNGNGEGDHEGIVVTTTAGAAGAMVEIKVDDPFQALPDELWLRVACFLTSKDVVQLRRVSRHWLSIVDDQKLWKTLCSTELGFSFNLGPLWKNYEGVCWKELFRKLRDNECFRPSYHDESKQILGCGHYQRACKIRPVCCGEWSVCRICHDEKMGHHMDRFATQEMFCTRCKTFQPVAAECNNARCSGLRIASYYCHICRLWEDNLEKQIYHCPHCGFCRLGRAADFYHCFQCKFCIHKTVASKHRCKPGQTLLPCPACKTSGPLWSGLTPVVFLPCGDAIHVRCYDDLIARDLPCPACNERIPREENEEADLDEEMMGDFSDDDEDDEYYEDDDYTDDDVETDGEGEDEEGVEAPPRSDNSEGQHGGE